MMFELEKCEFYFGAVSRDKFCGMGLIVESLLSQSGINQRHIKTFFVRATSKASAVTGGLNLPDICRICFIFATFFHGYAVAVGQFTSEPIKVAVHFIAEEFSLAGVILTAVNIENTFVVDVGVNFKLI